MRPASSDIMLVRYDPVPSSIGMPAQAFDPITRQFLLEAGIAPGMRVLEFASGTGELTFILAELVGPEGHVVGLEESEQAVLLAQGITAERGLEQVQFVNASVSDGIPSD